MPRAAQPVRARAARQSTRRRRHPGIVGSEARTTFSTRENSGIRPSVVRSSGMKPIGGRHLEAAPQRAEPSRDRPQQLALAVPFDRRYADDLARADIESDAPRTAMPQPLSRGDVEILRARAQAIARPRPRAGGGISDFAADHRLRSRAAGRPVRRGSPLARTAPLPLRSTVTRSAAASASSSLWVMSTAAPPSP